MVLAEDLRQAVLQAALQGKLTEQLDTDSDVDEMLENILKEKKNLLNEKKAREEKEIPTVDEEEKSYDIPDNWRWERLGNIGIYKKGPFGSALTKSIFVPKGQNTVKVYEQKNAIQKDASLGEYYITKEYFESKMKGFIVEAGDIIVSCAGTIGETYIMPNDIEFGIINQALMRMNIVPSLNINYFLMYFDNILKSEARKGSKGSAIKNIPPFDVFKRMFIPLPPIEEQQRIVDKINEIMPKIDEYEKIEKEFEALKKEFPTNMKDALLQSAMQGKLTEQLESDSSVDELLQEIGEKELKYSNWKAKKEFQIDEILDIIDTPIIPNSWKWVKLSDIALSNIGLTYKTSDKTSDGVIVLRSSNIQNGKMDYNDIVKINMAIPENKMCDIGDIVMCVRNGSKSLIGKVAVIDKPNMSFGAFMSIIKSRCNQFLYYFFTSNIFKKQMHINSSTETINQITQDMLFNCVIPLPPIEEQQRIVERLDALLPLCEDLREE